MEKDYKLEKEEYYETVWYIKRYPKFLRERESISILGGQKYSYPRGSEIGDPVAQSVFKLDKVNQKIKPIEDALKMIPEEYRKGLLENIIKKKRYPDYADTSTWKRWRRRFVYWVAMNRREQ